MPKAAPRASRLLEERHVAVDTGCGSGARAPASMPTRILWCKHLRLISHAHLRMVTIAGRIIPPAPPLAAREDRGGGGGMHNTSQHNCLASSLCYVCACVRVRDTSYELRRAHCVAH